MEVKLVLHKVGKVGVHLQKPLQRLQRKAGQKGQGKSLLQGGQEGVGTGGAQLSVSRYRFSACGEKEAREKSETSGMQGGHAFRGASHRAWAGLSLLAMLCGRYAYAMRK
jgi:hypothetical protein